MKSFRSHRFPETRNKFVAVQEASMQYYAVFAAIILGGVLVAILKNKPVGWFLLIAMPIAFLSASALGRSKYNGIYAEILFSRGEFALITGMEIFNDERPDAFPLRLANPARLSNGDIQLNYHDQIIRLTTKDWPDIDEIWAYLQPQPETNFPEINIPQITYHYKPNPKTDETS